MADEFDVIVVGSGAGGGMMAYELTKNGVSVLLMEAGRRYDPETESAMFQLPKEAPLRGESTPDKENGFFDATVDGGFDIPGEPYKSVGDGFKWWRARQMGGRTLHFGRQVPRYGPEDFKTLTHTGEQFDWPVTYDDMAPYYDRVETVMGLYGPDADGAVYNSPQSPNNIRQKPPAPRATEMVFAKACEKMGIKTMAHPTAVLTSPLNGRQACFYATNCIRGCSIGAAFDSVTAYIKPAEETGKLTILPNAIAYNVIMDDSGKKATGIRYIDKSTKQSKEISARVVVLSPSAMESSRILLNSAPGGLANSSGLVGKYISDTTGSFLLIRVAAFENLPPHNEDGVSQPHLYAPWWLHGEEKKKAGANFTGGYKLEVDPYGGARHGPPSMNSTFAQLLTGKNGLYGKRLKDYIRSSYGSVMGIRCLGSQTVSIHNYIAIDEDVKDEWGVPTPIFHWHWTDDDYRRAIHMNESLHSLCKNMGGEVIFDGFEKSRKAGKLISTGGTTNHEVGGCRMGDDPKTSVLNKHCQTWDVDNLYLADGSGFVTHAEKNPTLTIMALSLRAADNIIERLKENDL